jgi:hypothetical protein
MSTILTGIGNLLTFVDDNTFNFVKTAKETKEAIQHEDLTGVALGAIEHTNGYVEAAHYAATATNKGGQLAGQIAAYTTLAVDQKVVNALDNPIMNQALAGIGVVLSAISIIVSSIGIYRQTDILSQIPSAEELQNKEQLKETLQNLSKLNYNQFIKSLPEHLKKTILEHPLHTEEGTLALFSKLAEDLDDDNKADATQLVTSIQTAVAKKRVVSVLNLIGGVISLIASIGVLVACPPMAIAVLGVIGLALAIACFMASKGWAENSAEGFDWKLCLPGFVQNLLKDPVEEHNEKIPAEPLDPKVALAVAQYLDANKPEPSVWEKFKAFFVSEDKIAASPLVTENQAAQQRVLGDGANQLPQASRTRAR